MVAPRHSGRFACQDLLVRSADNPIISAFGNGHPEAGAPRSAAAVRPGCAAWRSARRMVAGLPTKVFWADVDQGGAC